MTKNAMMAAAEKHPGLIPEPYDAIFERFGFEGLSLVVDVLGGQNVYVPRLRTVLSGCIMAQAVAEYGTGGQSIERVARKYGYTSRNLRRHIKAKGSK